MPCREPRCWSADAPAHLNSSGSALVTARGESAATTYLLYDGRRARVDLRNHAVVRALKLDGIAPRPVSRALLDAVPEVPEITAPVVPRVGASSPVRGFPVGTVVRLARAGSAEYYVALADGVQRVGEVAADLIRFTYSHRRDIVTVAPGLIGSVPIVDELPVTTFPDRGGVANGRGSLHPIGSCARGRFTTRGRRSRRRGTGAGR